MGTTAPTEPVTSPAPALRDQSSWVDVTASSAVAVAVALLTPLVSSIHPIIPVAITPAVTAFITVAVRRLLTRDPDEPAGETAAPPPSRRPPPLLHGGWIVALVAAFLAFVTALVLVTVLDVARGRGLDESTLVGARVEIPAVAGQAGSQASEAVRAAGLVAEPVREFSSDVRRFRVVRTDPQAGTSVRKGSSVKIVVSAGPRPVARVEIPAVAGRPLDDAVALLDGLGLAVDAPASDGTSQTVTGVDPEAGSVVAVGSAVRLMAETAVTVPSLAGSTQAEATSALESAGLQARVEPVDPDGNPPGTVLGSEPAEGSAMAPGSTVTIMVAALLVEDVAGLTADDARLRLDALGFGVTVSEQPSETLDAGLVLRTVPAAGTRHTGSVELVVSAGRSGA